MQPSLTVFEASQQAAPYSIEGLLTADSTFWPVTPADGKQPDLTIEIYRPLDPSEAKALRSVLPPGVKVFLSTRRLREPGVWRFVSLDTAADAFVAMVEGGAR